jgi:UDP-N-acetylglucosamine--N-acetylmuramyl-(pentapeptide) pyrophosphoryl-undecaprenol N-acetylglucosamine transferase
MKTLLMTNKKIIIAGGGTGGHIFPAIAIANALKEMQPGIEVLFVGARGKMEMEKVPQAGYPIKGIDIAGFNRSSLIKNIGLPLKLVKSYFQVRTIVADFMPDAVVGVGGYSTYPVLRYAQSKGIPSFIFESNSFAGKANKMLAKRTTRVFVASDGMEKFFPAEKMVKTGNPVRRNIATSTITREAGIQFFGLDAAKKTVLAIGGSLGAKSINEALGSKIDEFENNQLQLIWQTGKTTAAQYRAIAEGKKNVWVGDFITQMDMAYAAADIIISRSGSTVYELCVVAKPAVLVPFPYATEDHQTANAMNLVNKHAALLVPDSEANEKLVPVIIELSGNEPLQKQLKENIGRLGITNADKVIASEILEVIGKEQVEKLKG